MTSKMCINTIDKTNKDTKILFKLFKSQQMVPLNWTNDRTELDGDHPIESEQILVVGFCLLGF